MPENFDFTPFVRWVMEKPESRLARIEFDPSRRHQTLEDLKVWVYDYGLQLGQHVETVEEIDLEVCCARRELMEYERLRAKYAPRKEAIS